MNTVPSQPFWTIVQPGDALPVAGEREAFEAFMSSAKPDAALPDGRQPVTNDEVFECIAWTSWRARAALTPTTPVPADYIDKHELSQLSADFEPSISKEPVSEHDIALYAATPAQQTQSDAVAGAAPTGDELRAIARQARNTNGPSDPTDPTDYVLAGWRAALATPPQQATPSPTTSKGTK